MTLHLWSQVHGKRKHAHERAHTHSFAFGETPLETMSGLLEDLRG